MGTTDIHRTKSKRPKLKQADDDFPVFVNTVLELRIAKVPKDRKEIDQGAHRGNFLRDVVPQRKAVS